jgi:molybdopterin/thiamine biosynthesis adenylyltransferase
LPRGLAESVERFVEENQGQRTLSADRLEALAEACGLSRHEAEIGVMELGILPERYARNVGTVGLGGQLALSRSCVAVVGLGGLGGFVVEGLSRMGIGHLVLIDGDVFYDHNLNRQLLSQESYLGRKKAEVAGERVRAINGAVELTLHAEYATRESLPRQMAGVDVVVDALDRVQTRLTLQEVAAEVGVPMVHGAIAGWMGQVMTIFPGDDGLRTVYGSADGAQQGAESVLGCPAASPMMVAAWQVHETVKILLGTGDPLQGRMMFIDAEMGTTRILRFDKDTGTC